MTGCQTGPRAVSRLLVVALTCGVLTSTAVNSQTTTSNQPAFQTNEQYAYVQVDVGVTDRAGAFVGDFQADDFEVLEDGRRQKVSSVTLVDLPIVRSVPAMAAPVSAAVDAAVSTNAAAPQGRIYALVLDDLHVDARWTAKVKELSRRFIDSLAANDQAMVLLTGGSGQGRRLTANREALAAAIDRFIGQKLPSASLERNALRARARELSIPIDTDDPFEGDRVRHARAFLATLRETAAWMRNIPGQRKSMIVFSEGIDYDVSDLVGTTGRMTSADLILGDTRDMVSAANRANVSLYTIDPRGLARQADETIVGSVSGGTSGAQAMRKELLMAQDSLRRVAQETGGATLLNSNDAAALFEQVVSESSRYYLLAYDAPAHENDGRFHRIEVRVKRPGMTVRSRSGYASPTRDEAAAVAGAGSSAVSPALLGALRNPLPMSAFDLRVFTVPFRGSGARASVLVGVEMADGAGPSFMANSAIELGLVAIDASGAVATDRRALFTLNLQTENLERANDWGMRMLERIELQAGSYELRVAVRDGATGAVASLTRAIVVPDFTQRAPLMSEPLLTSLASERPLTLRADQALGAVLSLPPSSARTFERRDELTALVELYTSSALELACTVEDELGAVVYETRDERAGPKATDTYVVRIPLDDFTPGRYVLKLEARTADQPPTERRVAFAVTENVP